MEPGARVSDNRRWLLSKLWPKQYGDKVTQEITGIRPIIFFEIWRY